MEREGLDRLSREELLELLAQQAEVIGRQQTELAAREAAIERRDEKIRELEEELSQFRRPAKTPENSSVPPSRGQKANRVEGWRRKLGPNPRPSAPASWPPLASRAGTSWTPSAPSPAPLRFRRSLPHLTCTWVVSPRRLMPALALEPA